ncbi:hypothetical protein J1614_006964 [Plenodomus biglobosus]|nr:hypothetical protein J1614_006964 [Plenodomus biglobosus]
MFHVNRPSARRTQASVRPWTRPSMPLLMQTHVRAMLDCRVAITHLKQSPHGARKAIMLRGMLAARGTPPDLSGHNVRAGPAIMQL